MLSDYERKKLSDVERRLMADDPELARSFQKLRRQPAPHRRIGMIVKVAVAVTLLAVAILLLAESAMGAIACLVTIGLTWAVWRYPRFWRTP